MATSDEFLGSALDPSWTFVDPLGGSSVAVAGSLASIAVPGGSAHSTDQNANNAPYIYQTVADGDLDLSAKFDSLTRKGQSSIRFQGIIAYNAAGTDRVGFITFNTATSTALFAFSRVGGSGASHLNLNLTNSMPSHLRLTRAGDVWTCLTSADGTTWTQRAQFTRALTVARAGLFAGNSTPGNPAFTSRIDWWHVGAPSVPAAPEVTRTAAMTDDFTGADGTAPDAGRWVVDNGPGGSATIQGNQLRLRHTPDSGSRGAVYTVTALANIGGLFRYRFADIVTPPHWLAPGFSAGQTPAVSGGGAGAAEGLVDPYSPRWGYVHEIGGENNLGRPFRVDDPNVDGVYQFSTYVQLGAAASPSQTTFRWCRIERLATVADARGLLRLRTWADGDPEPLTWDLEMWDGVHDGPGRFCLSYGNNAAGSGPATRDAFVDQVTLYEVAEEIPPEPSAPTPAERTLAIPADPRTVTAPADPRTLVIPEEVRRVDVPA